MVMDERDYDQLIYANSDLVTNPITIAQGEVIKRGDLLVSSSIDGPFKKTTTAFSMGDATADPAVPPDTTIPCVAVADCDATAAATSANGYVAGKFDGRFMNGGTGFGVDPIVANSRDYLLGYSIYVLER